MVTSTPNGTEGVGKFFFEMFNNSVDSDEIFDEDEQLRPDHLACINDKSRNGFVSVKYHWSETRSEEWYQEQVRELNFDMRRVIFIWLY